MQKTGQCLCGKVNYSLNANPIATAVCHCKNCQRQSGSAFSLVILSPASAVSINGETKTYKDTADSGAALERMFCPDCGSALFSRQPEGPDVLVVKAGTLDDTSWLKPQLHIWCDSAQSWVELPDNLPKFPQGPPK